MTTDLAKFEQADTYEYTLETPDGQVLDVKFTIAGPTHPNRRGISDQSHRKLARAINRRGSAEVMAENPNVFYDEVTDAIVNAVLGWSNLVIDGKEVPFNAAESRALFTNERFAWVRTQVLVAMNNAANFIRRSSSG